MSICLAARVLGMAEHAQHIFSYHWDRLMNGKPKYEDIATLEGMAATSEYMNIPKDDVLALFDGIVKHLAHMYINREVPEPRAFQAFMTQHDKMRRAMLNVRRVIANERKMKEDGDPIAELQWAQQHALRQPVPLRADQQENHPPWGSSRSNSATDKASTASTERAPIAPGAGVIGGWRADNIYVLPSWDARGGFQ